MRRTTAVRCVPERAAAAGPLFCQHSATIVKWYFCAMCLFPRPRVLVLLLALRRSFVVDWARLHFGKAPNVSIVAAGGGERRQRRPTKPRQGHKHHENMVLSGRQPACHRGYGTLAGCSTYSADRAHPGYAVQCMHGTQRRVVQCAGLPRHPIPLVSLRTPDKKASNGARRLDD